MITAMRHGRVSQPGSLKLPDREPHSLQSKTKTECKAGTTAKG